jgi:hypothetical protein
VGVEVGAGVAVADGGGEVRVGDAADGLAVGVGVALVPGAAALS